MKKILIVDDEKVTCELLEAVLQSDGYEPHSVNQSTKALQTVEEIKPDLILMDIMMPQINGIAVCKLIKSDADLQHIPVVMISALSDEGAKKDSFNAGASAFITKPILPKDLLAKIKELL